MNLTEILLESSNKYGAKPAIILEGRTYSFKDINEGVCRYALWLKEMGIHKGDRIALQLDKGMEFVFLHLAGLSVGAITVPLNPGYTPDEVVYYVSDSGSALYITDAERWDRIRPLSKTLNNTRPVLIDGEMPDGSRPLKEIVTSLNATDPRNYPTEGEDVAVICYTSGTTGRSKGAMITHRNLISNMKGLKEIWEWTDRDRLLHVLPLFHVHGLMVALHGALNAGSTTIMFKKFDPFKTWQAIEEKQMTMLMAVPTIYHRLVNEWDRVKPDIRSMRLFISGSAPLSEGVFERFEAITGFRILERYGMTEAQMITSNPMEPLKRVPKSVGYPLPGVQIRIVSPEGYDVKPGDVGEVWVKGDNVFKGYWRMPEKTAEAIEGGWLKSGDLGYQDSDDDWRLYLVGRAKELIISGGFNVYPKEVESVLEKHEAVHEVAVFGLPDEDLGERVAAAVVLSAGYRDTISDALIAFSKGRLAGYKCPKQVFLIENLPKNAMAKIQKNTLRHQFSSFKTH